MPIILGRIDWRFVAVGWLETFSGHLSRCPYVGLQRVTQDLYQLRVIYLGKSKLARGEQPFRALSQVTPIRSEWSPRR